MDPNDWQRYRKKGPQSRSGGMDLGIGGGSGNLGIADYLTTNFDNLGGGELSPQQQLMETQKAIREGGAMKSPETDVTRFITEAPDGSNYMDPKPAEIPPMLARQITDPTPPAPAKGSGIDPNMLVRSQGDAQSRGSNLANPMPRREDFRRREALARQMEDDAIKLGGNKGAKFWGGDLVTDSIAKKMAVAQQLRQGDDADYKESLNQYFIQNPGQHEEWKRRVMMEKKIIPRFAPVNAINPGTKNLVGVDEYGNPKEFPGVMPQSTANNADDAERMRLDDERKSAEEKLNRTYKDTASKREYDASMARTAAQNKATDARGPNGQKPEAIEYPGEEEEKIAKKGGPPGSPGYDTAMQRQGFMVGNRGTEESPIWYYYRPKKQVIGGGAAAPATGAKGAAPAKGGGVKWGRDANGKPIPIGG